MHKNTVSTDHFIYENQVDSNRLIVRAWSSANPHSTDSNPEFPLLWLECEIPYQLVVHEDDLPLSDLVLLGIVFFLI